MDFAVDLIPGDNITSYRPTPMRLDTYYIRFLTIQKLQWYIYIIRVVILSIVNRNFCKTHLLIFEWFSKNSIYVTWMYLVFMYIIPFSCLAIFNVLIFLAIRRASVQRALLTTQEKKDHNLASMFLVVVMVFFICNSLSLIVNILEV